MFNPLKEWQERKRQAERDHIRLHELEESIKEARAWLSGHEDIQEVIDFIGIGGCFRGNISKTREAIERIKKKALKRVLYP